MLTLGSECVQCHLNMSAIESHVMKSDRDKDQDSA